MHFADIDPALLRKALKEVLVETLHEQPEFLREVFLEAVEDLALVEAIRQGRETELVEREAISEAIRRP